MFGKQLLEGLVFKSLTILAPELIGIPVAEEVELVPLFKLDLPGGEGIRN